MQKILITGANRGIGLELVRQYLQYHDVLIFAACRKPEYADQLNSVAEQNSGRLRVLQMDINDETSIDAAVQSVAAQVEGLDLLINNAGIYPKGDHQSFTLGQLSAADVGEVVVTNSVGPLMVTQACRHLLGRGQRARVVMISSGMGSISGAAGGSYGYRMSKASMNMASRILAMDGAMGDIITVTTHPGWVQTDMGGPAAELSPSESAAALVRLIGRLTPSDNGRFFRWDGVELDW